MMYQKIINKPFSISTSWLLFLIGFLPSIAFVLLLGFTSYNNSVVIWKIIHGSMSIIFCTGVGVYLSNKIFQKHVLSQGHRTFLLQLLVVSCHVVAILSLFLVYLKLIYLSSIEESLLATLPYHVLVYILLVTNAIASFSYLHAHWGLKHIDSNVPCVEKLIEYEAIIYDLFTEQKLYLQPNINLSIVAQHCGIDKEELQYFFTNHIGKEFQQYLAELRIAHAVELFQTKGKFYTLEAIAKECGYQTRSTFSTQFKQILGVSPSEYLKM